MENPDPNLSKTISGLLEAKGLDCTDMSLFPIDGGGNNRVFAVDIRSGRFLAKAYFNDATDTRDRLGGEYGFLSYATDLGLTTIPRPVARCSQRHLGIYEFVSGTKIGSGQLRREHVLMAGRFFSALNADTSRGRTLPPASEACFDVAQHVTTVDRRIERLRGLVVRDDLDREAQRLVTDLSTVWERRRQIASGASVPSLSPDERCISPSDFGFHNALLKPDGTLCFIDFEYAGWDDPAKMIGDFFCQPAVPVPTEYFDDFISAALDYSDHSDALRTRAHRLLPVIQTKWCCIMLNEFLPESARRRQFANPASSLIQRKRVQLDKTWQFFQSRLV